LEERMSSGAAAEKLLSIYRNQTED
ncbi:MAG: hypothetical protein ABEK84_03840, partial [Salinibacter sp.]